ncbi:hypothetical protein [Botryobacter ruber]|uniref:hypothetical protein n=1 Tax=Botryobacter ruber TaxID=2171629 RepID=UPI001F0B8E60|nr:hypothetical protein [Botryobacter ruber]
MLLSPIPHLKLSKLNLLSLAPAHRMQDGEQYIIQTMDKKLTLTNCRVILKHRFWELQGCQSIKLEDITRWEVKTTGKVLYFGLSLLAAFMVYYNDSFALFSGFFLMLYLLTRHRRIHLFSEKTVMVLPLEVDESQMGSLIELVRQAKKARVAQLRNAR